MNTIVKRMQEMFSRSGKQQVLVSRPDNIACTRHQRLRQMQSELCNYRDLTEKAASVRIGNQSFGSLISGSRPRKHTSMEDLICARIAAIEMNQDLDSKKPIFHPHDKNQTIMDLNLIEASIYFWSPFGWDKDEERKLKLMQSRAHEITCPQTNTVEPSGCRRNKDAFVNFSQQALTLVAKSPETPTATLRWLAAHHDTDVRKAVAKNENSDNQTLEFLCEDQEIEVKIAILDNPRIYKTLAAKLANDKNVDLSSKAMSVYSRLDMASTTSMPSKSKQTAKHDILQVEREFLRAIAESASTCHRMMVKSVKQADHIRMLVAGAPNATAEILWQLAKHPVSQVKRKFVDKTKCLLETEVNLSFAANEQGAILASATETVHEVPSI